jgi:hypothetical protein
MSHAHFCDYTGHYWTCHGKALRLFARDTEPSTCICPKHQTPISDGDHASCPVELLACPEHCEMQFREMGAASIHVLPRS